MTQEFEELFEKVLAEQPEIFKKEGNPEHLKILLQGTDAWNRWKKDNPEVTPNLKYVDLTVESIKKTDIDEKNSEYVKHLSININLNYAHLMGADFMFANLRGASLSRANLENAVLTHAHLEEVPLMEAHLERANLRNAHLEKTYLMEAHLEEADLTGAHLEEACFRDAYLERANLEGAYLKKTFFASAHLEGANLSEANFEGANLSGVNFEGTNLSRANFENADVTDIIYKKQIRLGKMVLWKKNTIKSFKNIRVATCYGNPLFKRYAQDMDYLCQFKKEHKYLYYLWQYSSNFGQSLLLWAGWSFLLAILFATVFYFMGTGCFYINPHKVGNLPFDFLTMSYYSIVTFTTLGFGDVTPITRTAAFLVTFEVIFGYIMLGGLISIFANKLARRS